MEIEDAFTQEAIANAGTDITGSEEVEVRKMIRRVCEINDPPIDLQREHENVALLCFIAGRTYEQDSTGFVNVPMPLDELADYHQFLRERGQS